MSIIFHVRQIYDHHIRRLGGSTHHWHAVLGFKTAAQPLVPLGNNTQAVGQGIGVEVSIYTYCYRHIVCFAGTFQLIQKPQALLCKGEGKSTSRYLWNGD